MEAFYYINKHLEFALRLINTLRPIKRRIGRISTDCLHTKCYRYDFRFNVRSQEVKKLYFCLDKGRLSKMRGIFIGRGAQEVPLDFTLDIDC